MALVSVEPCPSVGTSQPRRDMMGNGNQTSSFGNVYTAIISTGLPIERLINTFNYM